MVSSQSYGGALAELSTNGSAATNCSFLSACISGAYHNCTQHSEFGLKAASLVVSVLVRSGAARAAAGNEAKAEEVEPGSGRVGRGLQWAEVG